MEVSRAEGGTKEMEVFLERNENSARQPSTTRSIDAMSRKIVGKKEGKVRKLCSTFVSRCKKISISLYLSPVLGIFLFFFFSMIDGLKVC